MLGNWANMLSHMEVLLLIYVPPVCHHDTINTMWRDLCPFLSSIGRRVIHKSTIKLVERMRGLISLQLSNTIHLSHMAVRNGKHQTQR